MTSFTRSLLYYLPAVLFLTGQVTARHSHHQHIRQVAVAVPIISIEPTPSTTIQATRVSSQASSEFISDIEDIKEGIEDFPGNLLVYIQSVEQRLETVEALLQSLLSTARSTSVAALPYVTATSASSNRLEPAPFSTSKVLESSLEDPRSALTSSLRSSASSTSGVTSTRTSGPTVTRDIPIPVLSTGTAPRPYGYVPLGNGNLTLSTGGVVSSTRTRVITLTVAVLPMPSRDCTDNLCDSGENCMI